MHSTARPLSLRSGLVAYVDPALLPDDLVEDLALRGAIVIAKASGPEALIHLDEEGRTERIERQERPALASVPEDAVVVDLEAWRYARVRAKVKGALASAVALAPAVALMPPLVRLGG